MGKTLITILFAGYSCGVLALAQSVPSAADRAFIHKAAEGGMAEVKLGQLAADKGSSQPVKDFGQRMVKDHSQANDQLKGIAAGKNVPLPDSLDAKDKALYDRLSGLSGEAFDKAYMRAMIKDHMEDVADFQSEAKTAHDQDIRSFVSMTLPTLRDHLKMAREVGGEVGVTSLSAQNR